MLAKRIIPCLDVTGGRVVKGVNFVNLIDAGDPVEAAIEYDRQGADELVFLDITATSDNRASMYDVVRRTAENVFIPLTVGGGIRSVEDIRLMLNSGADKISVNSSAVANPDLIRAGAERFGKHGRKVGVALHRQHVRGARQKRRGQRSDAFAKSQCYATKAFVRVVHGICKVKLLSNKGQTVGRTVRFAPGAR